MQNQKIKLVIADDSSDFSYVLSDYLEKQKDFLIVGIAKDGIEAIKYIQEYQPDVLILDIMMPKLDGIGVLERMHSIFTIKLPKVIMLSGIGLDHITQQAINLGAEYYVVKPFDLGVLSNRIRQLFSIDLFTEEVSLNLPVEPLMYKQRNNFNDIELEITDIMHQIGIPANIQGYIYLREAIELVIDDVHLLGAVTKLLYPSIAERHHTTPGRVERAIRHAIELAISRCSADLMDTLFLYSKNNNKAKPTNCEFIAIISDRLKLQMKIIN